MSSAVHNLPQQRPLWRDTSKELPLDAAPATGAHKVKVAVVGGGYTGLSAALHLAERGVNVAVFEAGLVGAGASGVNGGQVIPGLKRDPADLERLFPEKGREITKLFGNAADLVFSLIERHAIDCAPERSGWIQAAHAPLAIQSIEARRHQWASRGADIISLSAEEIAKLTGSRAYVGGFIDNRAGILQPLAYARGLARAARKLGAFLFENSPVLRLARQGGVWKLSGQSFEVRADHVVIATDAYSGSLLPMLERSLLTVGSLQIATEPLSASEHADILPSLACLSETRKVAIYMRRGPDDRLLIGGRGPIGDSPPAALYDNLQKRLIEIFPKVRGLRVDYRWQGKVGLTIDELPHLHEPQEGLHIGVGYNGRGVAAATTMGKIIADRISRGALSEVLPVTNLTSIPWRVIRQPLLVAAVSYYRMRDRLGFGA